MGRKKLSVLGGVMLFGTLASVAEGELRRETTASRPYVIEIGEPYEISQGRLEQEVSRINGMREYLRLYGRPDYAEIQEVAPDYPWDTYEVRCYYLRPNIEVDFGHVTLSPSVLDYGLRKYEGQIAPDKRHQIDVILEARQMPPSPPPLAEPVAAAPSLAEAGASAPAQESSTEALLARMEAAAERAAGAADRATEMSEAATRSAERTVDIVERMERSLEQGR